MRRIVATLILLAATVVPVVAQKIGTETSDRTRIVHLKTALNHLTVIEVGEPVLEVAAGSPSFKVEWRENKVFVQPMEADTATNLFIWTASQRLNYELEPAGAVASMDFAVDQAAVHIAEPMKPTAATTPSRFRHRLQNCCSRESRFECCPQNSAPRSQSRCGSATYMKKMAAC